MRKEKKLPEVLVYNGSLHYNTVEFVPKWLSVTKLEENGKVIFQNLYPVGYITARKETGSDYYNNLIFNIFHLRICRKTKDGGDFAVILVVGKQLVSLPQGLCNFYEVRKPKPLDEEWNGIDKETDVYVSSVQSQKGAVGVIHCEVGTVEDCPEEIRPIYKEKCLIGVSCIGENVFERIFWHGNDYHLNARVVIFSYKNKKFALFEIDSQYEGCHFKTNLIGKIIKLEW
ncbi:MAG: hypothetical protein WCO12_03210 [bacterium]